MGLHDDQLKHLEERIDRYLQEQHYSDFAGFSIKLPDRRKLAVEWFAKHMRAIMQIPDPPRSNLRGWAVTLDEAMAAAQDPNTPIEYVKELKREFRRSDSPICSCERGPSVCQVHGPPADR